MHKKLNIQKLNLKIKKRNNLLIGSMKNPKRKTSSSLAKNSLLKYVLIAIAVKRPTFENIKKLKTQHTKDHDERTNSNFIIYFEHLFKRYKNFGTILAKRARYKLRNDFCGIILKHEIVALKTQKRLNKTIIFGQTKPLLKKTSRTIKKLKRNLTIKKTVTSYEKKKIEYLTLLNKKHKNELKKVEKNKNEQKSKIAFIQRVNLKLKNSKGFRWQKKYKFRSQQALYNFKKKFFKSNSWSKTLEKHQNTKQTNNSPSKNGKENWGVKFEKSFKTTQKQKFARNLEQKLFKLNPGEGSKQSKFEDKKTFIKAKTTKYEKSVTPKQNFPKNNVKTFNKKTLETPEKLQKIKNNENLTKKK